MKVGMSKKPHRTKSNLHKQANNSYEQGFAHYQAGDLQKSEKFCRDTLSLTPHHSDALHLLGMIYSQKRKTQKAIVLINKAIAIDPEKYFYHLNLGNIYFSSGKYEKAEISYRKALKIHPEFIPSIIQLAKTLKKNNRLNEAIDYFKKAHAIDPKNPSILTDLGNTLLAAGLTEESIYILRELVEIAPGRAESHYNLGGALKQYGDMAGATAEYKKAVQLQPDFIYALHNLGLTYEALGQLKEGEACYRKAISIQPSFCLAHYQLAKVIKHSKRDNDIILMEKLFKTEKLSAYDRTLLAHGLGKAYEDLGYYEQALVLFKKANNLKRSTYQYRINDDRAYFEKIKKVFNQTLFKRLVTAGTSEGNSIFVLGMPRSGTSLVEQILASHPNVFGAGELPDLENIFSEKTENPFDDIDFEQLINSTNTQELAEMGREYLAHTNRFRQTNDTKYIVDKMPHNFLYIGMIKLILPNATIIHCTREPMDNCLSIYKNLFAADHKYACNLKELGEYYRLYKQLMEHWHKVLPGFIHDFSYENLIADQEKQTRALFKLCKIPWAKESLNFYKTKRSVATLSSSQVRSPIYKDSIKLWEKYGGGLDELARSLGMEDYRPN